VTATFTLLLPICLRARILDFEHPTTETDRSRAARAGPTARLPEPASNAEGRVHSYQPPCRIALT